MWTIWFHFLGMCQRHGFWELIKLKSNRGYSNFVHLCLLSPCFSSPPSLLQHGQIRLHVPIHHLWHCHSSRLLLPWKIGYVLPLRDVSELWLFPKINPNLSLLWWGSRSSSLELSITNLHPTVQCSSCSSLSHRRSSSAPDVDQFCLLLRSLE